MFGSFRMTYQGQQIQLGKWLSAKMIHLLLLLLLLTIISGTKKAACLRLCLHLWCS